MISLEDCIAFCGLDKDEVAAIAARASGDRGHRFGRLSAKATPWRGSHWTMITDDIHAALCAGRVKHAQELFMAL